MERQSVRRDIRARIKRAAMDWAASAEQRDEILRALRNEAYPLHSRARLRAGALSATAYRLGGGTNEDVAAWAGAIAELYMAAGFMLDDVMDADPPP